MARKQYFVGVLLLTLLYIMMSQYVFLSNLKDTVTGYADFSQKSYDLLQRQLSSSSSSGADVSWEALEVPWLNRTSCFPARNIAFLKIHKCASSTIQNLLMRYGEKNDLTFAMPQVQHIFPLVTPFSANMVKTDAPFHTTPVNIFTMHAIWNKEEVMKVLFPDAVSFTVVREPSEAFLSLYDFFAFETFYKMTLDKFVATHGIEMERFMGCLSYNIMACDMGAQPGDYMNLKAIKLLTYQMELDFDLVMIAERFEESLVLLSRLLCWPYEDLVILNANSRLKKKDRLTPIVGEMLRERLKPDYFIYNYFSEKFDRTVKVFGEEKMQQEVDKLRRVTEAKLKECNIVKVQPVTVSGEEIAGSSKVEQLVSNSTDPMCQNIIRPEQAFISRLKKKQAEMLKNIKSH